MRDPRLEKLADVLVNYSTGVRPGQLVRITAPSVASPLVAELYRRVVAAGGHPMVRLSPDELSEIFLKNASDEQLKYVNPVSLFEVERIDASIGVWADENTKALTNVDPKRMGLSQAARKPLMETFMQRAADGTLHWCGTQFPTQASAQDAEMSLAEYEDFVFSAGLLDRPDPVAAWRAVSERQQRLVDFLQRQVRLSRRRGQRHRRADERRRHDAGSTATATRISPTARSSPARWSNSVNGTVNFSFPAVHHGREVQDVRLTFKDGKVVDASASKGEEFLFSMLDMDAGSRFLGECAIGTNYNITRYTRNTLFDEKIGGTVHFALGAGYPETGNPNQSGLHWDMVVDLRHGGFVEIDGVKVNVDGRFTREGFPNP